MKCCEKEIPPESETFIILFAKELSDLFGRVFKHARYHNTNLLQNAAFGTFEPFFDLSLLFDGDFTATIYEKSKMMLRS